MKATLAELADLVGGDVVGDAETAKNTDTKQRP